MAHFGTRLIRKAEFDHLVLRPEGAIDQQQVRAAHGFEHVRIERAKAGGVKRFFARCFVDESQADVVAALRRLSMWRIRRWFSRARRGFRRYARTHAAA